MRILRTPYRAPNANAHAERWVRTVREEALDQLFILGEGHLRWILREYLTYYHTARPRQGLDQQTPIPSPVPVTAMGPLVRHDCLGGLLHDYRRAAEIPWLQGRFNR